MTAIVNHAESSEARLASAQKRSGKGLTASVSRVSQGGRAIRAAASVVSAVTKRKRDATPRPRRVTPSCGTEFPPAIPFYLEA